MTKFKYSPLGKELKAQTDIARKHYQKSNNEIIFKKVNTWKVQYIKSNT